MDKQNTHNMVSVLKFGTPILLIAALFGACNSDKKSATSQTASTPAATEPQFKKEGIATLYSPAGDSIISLPIEIAETDADRMQGMMYRTKVDAATGMLFLFDSAEPQSFWMKNTPSSLDIIFIGANGEILNVHSYTTPFSEGQYPSAGSANMVLETVGGYCKQHGIDKGCRLAFKRV